MSLRESIYAPLRVTGQPLGWDVWATVKGGGYSGQALAVQHGVAQAVQAFDIESYRPMLKKLKFLTIDTRSDLLLWYRLLLERGFCCRPGSMVMWGAGRAMVMACLEPHASVVGSIMLWALRHSNHLYT
jgi:hypothetical protein